MDWDRMPENPTLSVPKLRKSFSEDVNTPPPNPGKTTRAYKRI